MKTDDTLVIKQFENSISRYGGSRFGVSISCATNAIFLCLELLKYKKILKEGDVVEIPKHTYISVPMSIKNARLNVKFRNEKWNGCYPLILEKTGNPIVWDSAVRFTKDMYIKDSLYVLSFQYRKSLPIGRGGMVLTNSSNDYEILKLLRFDGRIEGTSQFEDTYKILGWNMYMLPEQCAKGLTLFNIIKDKELPDCACWKDYPDLSKQLIFKEI